MGIYTELMKKEINPDRFQFPGKISFAFEQDQSGGVSYFERKVHQVHFVSHPGIHSVEGEFEMFLHAPVKLLEQNGLHGEGIVEDSGVQKKKLEHIFEQM
ncbi:unnamed protein product [Allacma fusca]|uniref:Uncharacterized protein n=1 Tax=Allacma fusca TaxID=39272 RepID=A0A8J2KB21_9HEXA|nr:unnamed protein product [Allacma fusca]